MHSLIVRLERLYFDMLALILIAGIELNRLSHQALNALAEPTKR
jgi:hypothetical protein